MTIDESNKNIVVYPRQDVTVFLGHVDKMKILFLQGAKATETLSQLPEETRRQVKYNGLKVGKVRQIAGIWGEVKEPQFRVVDSPVLNETVKSLNSHTYSKTTPSDPTEFKKQKTQRTNEERKKRRRRRRKNRSAKTTFVESVELKRPLSPKNQTIISKVEKDKPPPSLESMNLTKIQGRELQLASERMEAFIHAYKCYYWPPKAKGVFRVSSGVLELNALEKQVSKLSPPELKLLLHDKFQKANGLGEHLLAGIIKKTLRDLSTPAIPSKLYNDCLSIANTSENGRMDKLNKFFLMMPPVHKRLIGSLMTFLKEIANYEKVTSMDIHNLAIVIAPNILIPPKGTPLIALLEDLNRSSNVVETMATYANDLY